MPRKTSAYLTDDVDAAVQASGLPLSEIIRRGVEARTPEEAAAEIAAARAVELAAVAFRSAVAQAVSDAQDAMLAEMDGSVERAVRSALRDAQGGSW